MLKKTSKEKLITFFKRRVVGVTAKEISRLTDIPLRTVQNNLVEVKRDGHLRYYWLMLEMVYIERARICKVSGTISGVYRRKSI